MPEVHPDQVVFFRLQSEQTAGRSPLYSELCRRLADNPEVAAIIESPPRWDAPLRLLSALHYLVLTGHGSWDDIDRVLVDEQDFLRRYVAEQAVQTNEVQRCWMLLPCFLEVARRYDADTVDVIELGASAGLNLGWDAYHYRYVGGEWGQQSSPLHLAGEERRPVPAHLLRRHPQVRSRIGVDLNPLDVNSDSGAQRLRSFVWAGQTDRLQRLDAAIAAARRSPPQLVRGDIAAVLPQLLARRRDDALTVVWQTAVLGYLPDDRRRLVHEAMAAAGATGPLAFVGTTAANDGSLLHYGLTVQTWPDGEREQLAHADFHGAWIDWLGTADRAPVAGGDL